MKQKDLDNVEWVCSECGRKYGSRIPERATFHNNVCGVCKKETSVTQPRDYGYLKLTK